MNTPIIDFVNKYTAGDPARFHMPGHKGKPFLGCESFDITEIPGADDLYAPNGIIYESERNTASIFGAKRTLFSTEGSSQCIRAMVYLALSGRSAGSRPYILAARNVHKSFIYALALCDGDAAWLYPDGPSSLCSCNIAPRQVEAYLKSARYMPSAVYVTSPDYLGNELDIEGIASVCHSYGVPLLVDNAHGSYLRFLPVSRHPLTLGADMCCDSAHKTLPALTGGAYLHIGTEAPARFSENAKEAMALFGSTSPSYLILCSLDKLNGYLDGGFRSKLKKVCRLVSEAKASAVKNGWHVLRSEPLKITVRCPRGITGYRTADRLRKKGVECEYADSEFVVLMASSETTSAQLDRFVQALGKNELPVSDGTLSLLPARRAMSIRDAVFSPQEKIPVRQSPGRICAAPAVSCPPAIPIAVSGEIISEETARLFSRLGIDTVSVVCRNAR